MLTVVYQHIYPKHNSPVRDFWFGLEHSGLKLFKVVKFTSLKRSCPTLKTGVFIVAAQKSWCFHSSSFIKSYRNVWCSNFLIKSIWQPPSLRPLCNSSWRKQKILDWSVTSVEISLLTENFPELTTTNIQAFQSHPLYLLRNSNVLCHNQSQIRILPLSKPWLKGMRASVKNLRTWRLNHSLHTWFQKFWKSRSNGKCHKK